MTISFLNKVIDHNIVLFRLSAHSTHLTQSLHVGVFQPFKHYHTEATDRVVRLGDTQFDKLEFLAVFQICRNQIFKKSTIRHVFKIIDLVSFNSNMMLNIIRERQNRELRTFSPSPSSLFERTSRGPESIVKYDKELARAFAQTRSNSGVNKTAIERFIRGSIAFAHSHTIVARDLESMRFAVTSRKCRNALRGTIAAKGEVIKVSECRELCSKRKEKKKEKARRKKESVRPP